MSVSSGFPFSLSSREYIERARRCPSCWPRPSSFTIEQTVAFIPECDGAAVEEPSGTGKLWRGESVDHAMGP